jgi:hypothetical protein
MWFTGINYYKLAVEKDRDSMFTTIRKPGLSGHDYMENYYSRKLRFERDSIIPEKIEVDIKNIFTDTMFFILSNILVSALMLNLYHY